MSELPPPAQEALLASARAEIDAIDVDIAALIARRARAVGALSAAKTPQESALRPAREVQLVRRLIAGAPAEADADVIVAVWRTLIAASLKRQRPIEVVAAGGIDAVRQFDIARQHFGAQLRLTRQADVRAALLRVAEGPDVVAVLPWPGASGPGSWWAMLAESRFHGVAVAAGLPMQAGEPEAALVASRVPLEPAGKDRTLLIAFDRGFRLQRALQEAGLVGRELARANEAVLVEVDGFMAGDDPRRSVLAKAGLDAVRVVGTFAPL